MAAQSVETWLYRQPLPGVVEKWYIRNLPRINALFPAPKILDGAFILASTTEEMSGGTLDFRYPQDRFVMTRTNVMIPKEGSPVYDAWQARRDQMIASGTRDGKKFSAHHISPFLTDVNLVVAMNDSTYSGVVLSDDLNRGKFPEIYRDSFLPTLCLPNGLTFNGPLPNLAAIQGIIVTADSHLVLTTRSSMNVDRYKGRVSPTFEEQMDRSKDNSPFDTFLRAVSNSPKLRRGEEFRLNVKPEKVRLVSVVLEPEFNSVSMVMIAVCEEESNQIASSVFGVDRDEFDPAKPIWTESLIQPDRLIRDFYNPPDFQWHGIGRERIVTALAFVHGYDEALARLYSAKP